MASSYEPNVVSMGNITGEESPKGRTGECGDFSRGDTFAKIWKHCGYFVDDLFWVLSIWFCGGSMYDGRNGINWGVVIDIFIGKKMIGLFFETLNFFKLGSIWWDEAIKKGGEMIIVIKCYGTQIFAELLPIDDFSTKYKPTWQFLVKKKKKRSKKMIRVYIAILNYLLTQTGLFQ